jgi:3-oxoadipate enol-lactonase
MKKIAFPTFLAMAIFSLIFSGCENKVTTGYADIKGTSIYYEVKGEGTPIILMHGFACDTRNWDNQFEVFSKDYKVVRFDFRGFGKSQSPDSAIAYSHTEDLILLLDYLNIEKAIVLGHSLGGKVAFQIAYEYPDRVLALILPEGGHWFKEIWEEPLTHDFINMFVEVNTITSMEGIEKGKEAWLKMSILDGAMKNPLSKDLTQKMTLDYTGWHWLNDDPQIQPEPISMHDFSRISVPTLLMTGELSIDFYSYANGINHQYIPNSKLVTILNSSHMLNLENPEQFNHEVLTFIKDNDIK